MRLRTVRRNKIVATTRRQSSTPLITDALPRRRLLSLCPATLLTCPCCCRSRANKRSDFLDKMFAEAMFSGMQDYERAIAPFKRSLFQKVKSTAKAGGTRVLELGMGTGPNLAYYSSDFESIWGIDPNPYMSTYLEENIQSCGINNVKLVEGIAENLPFDDASFDLVVSTLVLCSVENVEAVLSEVHRVLKPASGQFLWVEHTKDMQLGLRQCSQMLFDPLQQLLADGCHLTRDPSQMIEQLFQHVEAERFDLEEFGLIGPHVAGIARV